MTERDRCRALDVGVHGVDVGDRDAREGVSGPAAIAEGFNNQSVDPRVWTRTTPRT
ncbi:hypothetical protein [Halorubrum sp. DTA98]|uniref:hypothetical protein n=1 Tax=Halorubrum sp. DTA98 TaxID=3402163 RepID=UPI003AAFFFDB